MNKADVDHLCDAQAVLAVVMEQTRALMGSGEDLGDGIVCEEVARIAWGCAQRLKVYTADWPFGDETTEVRTAVEGLADYALDWLALAMARQQSQPARGSHG